MTEFEERSDFVFVHENEITVIAFNLKYLRVYDVCKNTWSVKNELMVDPDHSLEVNKAVVFGLSINGKRLQLSHFAWYQYQYFWNSFFIFKLHKNRWEKIFCYEHFEIWN